MVALLICAAHHAAAAPASNGEPQPFFVAPETSEKPAEVATRAPGSIQGSLGANGDPGGIRAYLGARGVTYSIAYAAEVLGNTSGGIKQGATYEGRLDGRVDVDLDKLAGLSGSAVHANLYEISGRGLSGNNTLDLFTVSGIEAYPSARLYEAWFEQKLLDGKFFVRAGQLAADREFIISRTATLFFNSTFGWPANVANNLPSGGPAFPLATPGLRVKYLPAGNITVLAALFDGDPSGSYHPGANSALPQVRDSSGTNFRLKDAPLFLTEADYTYNKEGDLTTLPGTIRLGVLHHFGTFTDAGQTTTTGATYRGDSGIYGIIDQTIYRPPNTDREGVGLFLRASAMPSDRNLIDLYFDGGLSYRGMIPGRPDDTSGIAAAYARIAPPVAATDFASGTPLVRDFQGVIEVTHQIAIVPGFSVQLDYQRIFHPGAHGVADPETGLPIHDASVFGLRSTIRY